MEEAGPTIKVCPSAGDLATKSAPMVPEAPALFSTITVVSQRVVNFGAKMRETISGPEPAVKGTINLTVPFKDCAMEPMDMSPMDAERVEPILRTERREKICVELI